MSDTEEFSSRFVSTGPFPPGMKQKKLQVIRYKGERERPRWIDLEPGQRDIFMVT